MLPIPGMFLLRVHVLTVPVPVALGGLIALAMLIAVAGSLASASRLAIASFIRYCAGTNEAVEAAPRAVCPGLEASAAMLVKN